MWYRIYGGRYLCRFIAEEADSSTVFPSYHLQALRLDGTFNHLYRVPARLMYEYEPTQEELQAWSLAVMKN